MDFCWTTIRVADMNTSLSFYRDLVGLEPVRRSSIREGLELAFLGSGDTHIELIADDSQPPPHHGSDISVGFRTDSLEELSRRLAEAQIEIEAGPFAPNPQVRFIFVRDPDGTKVQFVETAPPAQS